LFLLVLLATGSILHELPIKMICTSRLSDVTFVISVKICLLAQLTLYKFFGNLKVEEILTEHT